MPTTGFHRLIQEEEMLLILGDFFVFLTMECPDNITTKQEEYSLYKTLITAVLEH